MMLLVWENASKSQPAGNRCQSLISHSLTRVFVSILIMNRPQYSNRNKKHILVPLFFTLVLLVCTVAGTRGIWSSKPPITVSFHAEVEKPVDIEIKWANAAHAPFRADVGVFRKVTPANREVVVELPTRKVYRFRVDAGSYPGHVTLSKLQLRCGDKVVSFDDFNQFSYYNIENKSIEPGKLKLFSQHLDPYFEYQLPLEVVKTRRIDWFALGIICILSVLLAPVVVNTVRYAMAGRSMMEWKHAAFCSLFCGLLIIPVIKLDQRDILPEENRRMATFPKALNAEEGGVNYNFGKQFESWLQDRFNGRKRLIQLYEDVSYIVQGYRINKSNVAYDDNWMFRLNWSKSAFAAPSETEMNQAEENLQKLSAWCEKNGIKLYVMPCPTKEVIYAEKNRVGKYHKNDNVECFLRHISPPCSFVYPKSTLLSHKWGVQLTHYKTDTHQTEYGAYLMNRELLAAVRKDFPEIPEVDITKFRVTESKLCRYGRELPFVEGHQIHALRLSQDRLDYNYKYYDEYEGGEPEAIDLPDMQRITKHPNGKRRAVLLGDSYTYNQQIWLAYSFAEMLKIRFNNGKEHDALRISRFERTILDFKPDILIIMTNSSDHISFLQQLY